MCTVSWLFTDNGYHVFFNRDEQKTREKALVPDIYSLGGVNVVMPIDPQGGGTWLAVNEYGCTYALLNYYQGRFPKGVLRSRGQLVKNLASFKSFEDVSAYLDTQDLNKYPPFSLLCFIPNTIDIKPSFLTMIRWTGKILVIEEQSSPLISSSVKFEEVLSARLAVFNAVGVDANGNAESKEVTHQEANSKKTVQNLISIHRSHIPSASEYSVCMHREDAQTVSFSHVYVPRKLCLSDGSKEKAEIKFSYIDGPACSNIDPVSRCLLLS